MSTQIIQTVNGGAEIRSFALDLLSATDDYQGSIYDCVDGGPPKLMQAANDWLDATRSMVQQISDYLGVDIKAEWQEQQQAQWCITLTPSVEVLTR